MDQPDSKKSKLAGTGTSTDQEVNDKVSERADLNGNSTETEDSDSFSGSAEEESQQQLLLQDEGSSQQGDDKLSLSDDTDPEADEDEGDDEYDTCRNEENDYDYEVISSSAASESEAARKKFTFQVLSPAIVLENIDTLIHQISELIQLPASTTSCLLQHFQWRKEALTEAYYAPDSSDLLKLLGVPKPDGPALNKANALPCDICMDEFHVEEEDTIVGMCRHHFCNHCWCSYLKTKVAEGGGLQICCPAPKCPLQLSYARVKEFIEANLPQEVLQKYFQHVVNDIVTASSKLTWCLSPKSCTNAIQVDSVVASRRVDCSCGYCFCFGCQKDWHDPLKCEFLERWTKLCNEDALNAEWFCKNTKKCPRCKVPIQKNGGCNIMMCRNPSCRTEFCWACLTDGVTHSTPHACPLWPTQAQDEHMGREALNNRLVVCRNKYMGQKTSAKAEEKLIPKVEEAMLHYQTEGRRSCMEVTVFKKALVTLKECRQLLMYSCGFAYYLDIDPVKSDNNALLFDRAFQEFENAVEGLSYILENQLELEFGTVKKNLDIKVTNCDNRRLSLLAHVYEGYELGWWKFSAEGEQEPDVVPAH